MNNDRYMKIDEVTKISSYSRAQIYRLMKSGDFPSSYRLSANRVGWKESEIAEWAKNRATSYLNLEIDKNWNRLNEVWK